MKPAIELVLPRSLTTVGRGTVTFTVEIVGNAYRGWNRSCAVEGLVNGRGFAFQPGGKAAVSIPGDFVGRALLVVRLVDPRTGRGLVGDCPVEIRRWGDLNVRIDAGGHEVGEEGVIYQPIELAEVDSGALRVAEGEVRLPVVLEDEPLAGAWPLSAFRNRESLVRLPETVEEPARLLSLHVGPSLVVGRCYASQLRPEARHRLENAGEGKVHWVVRWDDARLSQLAARLSFRSAGDAPALRVENLSDYSVARQVLDLSGGRGAGGAACRRLEPGGEGETAIEAGEVLELTAGEDVHRRKLVRFRLDEVEVGKVFCPVLRTERTVFPFPPEGEDARSVRFLGAWVPIRSGDLRRLLELAGAPLEIYFPEAQLRLVAVFDPAGRQVTVGSNEDLSGGLH